MKQKISKITVLFIASIIALAGIGTAYAHWEQTIYIDGTVETGDMEVIIVPGSPSDTDNGIDPNYDKDVADTIIVIDPNNPHRAILTITNAYPCYEVYWHMTLRNIGTIPVKLQSIVVDNPGDPCITVEAWDGIGRQLDPISWGGSPSNYQEDVSGRVHVKAWNNSNGKKRRKKLLAECLPIFSF